MLVPPLNNGPTVNKCSTSLVSLLGHAAHHHCAGICVAHAGYTLRHWSLSRMFPLRQMQAQLTAWCNKLPDHQLPCHAGSSSSIAVQQWEVWATVGREQRLLRLLHKYTAVLDDSERCS